MNTPRNLKTIAGCPTRISVSITAPEATDTELTAYVNTNGTPIPAQIHNPNPNPNPNSPEPAEILFPPLPEGEHLYEIRCAGKPVAWGHLLARPTAYPLQPSDVVDWELAADLTATDAAQISLTLTPGPQGPKGDPGDITLDELPQENSTNFVTSGSVYTYVNYASSVILASMQEFYDDYWAHSNNSYQEKHVTAAQLGILSSLQSGSYGSAGVSGSLTLLQGGIALNSPDGGVKVEVRNSGLVFTSSSAPQWLDAATSQFYNLRTTKDLTIDDSDFLGLSNRTAALENALDSANAILAAVASISPNGSGTAPQSSINFGRARIGAYWTSARQGRIAAVLVKTLNGSGSALQNVKLHIGTTETLTEAAGAKISDNAYPSIPLDGSWLLFTFSDPLILTGQAAQLFIGLKAQNAADTSVSQLAFFQNKLNDSDDSDRKGGGSWRGDAGPLICKLFLDNSYSQPA